MKSIIFQMNSLLQYKAVVMRSRRRRPQPLTSGHSMSGEQDMEGPEGLIPPAKHVLIYHLFLFITT